MHLNIIQSIKRNITDEWDFSPGIMYIGRKPVPVFAAEDLGISQLLTIYSSLLYNDNVLVGDMDETDLKDTISDFKKSFSYLKLSNKTQYV